MKQKNNNNKRKRLFIVWGTHSFDQLPVSVLFLSTLSLSMCAVINRKIIFTQRHRRRRRLSNIELIHINYLVHEFTQTHYIIRFPTYFRIGKCKRLFLLALWCVSWWNRQKRNNNKPNRFYHFNYRLFTVRLNRKNAYAEQWIKGDAACAWAQSA